MLEDLIKERIKKGGRLKSAGYELYPGTSYRTHTVGDVLKNFAVFSRGKRRVTVAGRLFGFRNQGSLFFADLKDAAGNIQLVAKKENLEDYLTLRDGLDIGDFVEARGFLFITKKGEKSIEVKKLRLLTKSLRPIPQDRFGIEDVEARLRKRYLDLLVHPELREMFVQKSRFWNSMRSFLIDAGFLEVETPVLETTPGGADAEPFATHHNALDTDFYLRIALELPLKKLLVAGYEKVFEIGRIFRNEGMDAEHLQDYTQMEFYWAYQDYIGGMMFVEELYKKTVKATVGDLTTTWNGKKINWGKKWPRVDYIEIFEQTHKFNPLTLSREELFKKAEKLGLKPEPYLGKGRLIDLIFKKTIRQKMVQPCFLINPPAEIVPLAKRSAKNPELVERFQPVACGTELGNGYTELNDPVDQRERFKEQMKLREEGDIEAQRLDEDFLEALEYGMPPACGFGVSERLFAVLMDKPVRETVIFPLMRPKN